MAVINLSGFATSIFPDQAAFDMAVQSLIDLYETPLRSSVGIIKNLLVEAIERSNRTLLDKYPNLRDVVSKQVKMSYSNFSE